MEALPAAIAQKASLRGKEYGWPPESFHDALESAKDLSYACLGGQFQFRVAGSIREMYWLETDSSEREHGESWPDYVNRSCREVRAGFDDLLRTSDFSEEASKWSGLREDIGSDADPSAFLVFVAYFVSETEWASLQHKQA